MMRHFYSNQNRERANWFFVVLLGQAVMFGPHYMDIIPKIWTILKAVIAVKFFFLA